MANLIYDASKITGTNDLFDKDNKPQAGSDWIEVQEDVLVSKDGKTIYIGDNASGNISLKTIKESAKALIDNGIEADFETVILDDDDGNVATVNVDVDVDKLIMDNDALNGGLAQAKVNVSDQTDELKVISDMDAVNENINTANAPQSGVLAELNTEGDFNLAFEGSNDVKIKSSDAGAAGLDVLNAFDINVSGNQAISGVVNQNTNYNVGTASADGGLATIDWEQVKTATGWKNINTANCLFLQKGMLHNGKEIASIAIKAHKYVTITYTDGTTSQENLKGKSGGAGYDAIAYYDKDAHTLQVIGPKVATFKDAGAANSPVKDSSSSLANQTSNAATQSKSSDPTNRFKVNVKSGSADASNLKVNQKNSGTIGSNVKDLTFLTRNEVDFGAATYNEANISQNLDVTIEGNGGKIGFDARSGNYIKDNTKGERNLTNPQNAKITSKGNSLDEANLGGLASLKDTDGIKKEPWNVKGPVINAKNMKLKEGQAGDEYFLFDILEQMDNLANADEQNGNQSANNNTNQPGQNTQAATQNNNFPNGTIMNLPGKTQ